jgi:hypothetical protein
LYENTILTYFRRSEGLESILDIFEYDVSPISRAMISQNIHVGLWYSVRVNSKSNVVLSFLPEIVERPQPVVLAFDIETTKAPLKFPDAKTGDQIMMISWMIDEKGYLGVNREVVAADIEDFMYSPTDEVSILNLRLDLFTAYCSFPETLQFSMKAMKDRCCFVFCRRFSYILLKYLLLITEMSLTGLLFLKEREFMISI